VIRPAVAADVDAIRAVGVAAGERFRSSLDPRIADRADDPPFDPAELAAAVADGALWVADESGEVVGFLLAEVVDGCVHVEEVSVRPEAEGRGLGSALLDAVAERARAEGRPAVTLTTFADVPWNRPFYERRGFRVLHEDEVTPGLAAKVAAEAGAGLDPTLRVVMRRDL
jgi:GNAT superfamily N-acetyltransferase